MRYVLNEFLCLSLATKKKVKNTTFSNERHFDICLSKKKTIAFFNINYTPAPTHIHTENNNDNFACDNYIFPKTRGNKNKQC